MALVEFTLVLTGARTGKTVSLGNHYFEKGRARVQVYPESVPSVLAFAARSFKAYPDGTQELADAQKQDRENGIFNDLQADSPEANGASTTVQGAGDHAAGPLPDPRALLGGGDDGHQAGSAGMVSSGSGHSDAGLGEGVESGSERQPDAVIRRVQHVVGKLNYAADEHWSAEGLPSVAYVAEATEIPNVTRELIEKACPGWNRVKAEDEQAPL